MTGMIQKLAGKIIKIHGCEGAVTVRVERSFSKKITEMESLFLETDGRLVPFFIKSYQTLGHENLVLWFEDYDTVEKVKEFVGCRVFVSLPETIDEDDSLNSDLTDYEIFTPGNSRIGVITMVTENNGQFLITALSASGSELLIPLHEDFIVSLNKRLKRIVMSLPEGLITSKLMFTKRICGRSKIEFLITESFRF